MLPQNIEKVNPKFSALRRGEYTGYANGVWHIRRTGGRVFKWTAFHRETGTQVRGETLQAISDAITLAGSKMEVR